MVNRGIGLGTVVGISAALALSIGCGGKRTLIEDRDANRGGNAGAPEGGTSTGGSGAGSGEGGTNATGGNAAGRGGASASGGTAGAGGTSGGVGGTSGTSGEGGGDAGEGGAPVERCEPGEVRCVSTRERCSDDGVWMQEAFVCVKEVSGSGEYSVACAVKADGSVTCFGVAGDTWLAGPLRDAIPPGAFVDIDVADELRSMYSACVIADTGVTRCWGTSFGSSNVGTFRRVATSDFGMCGITLSGGITCPQTGLLTPPPDAGPFVDIDASNGFLYALREDGSSYSSNVYFELPEGTYVKLATGGLTTCAIRDDGALACNMDLSIPANVASERFVQIAVSHYEHICGIREDGSILCFSTSGEPLAPPAGKFVRITPIWSSMCAIRDDGSLHCFGPMPLVPTDGW